MDLAMHERRPYYELVISRAAWEKVVPALLTGSASVAVGRLRRNEHADRLELLADDLHVDDRLPYGDDFPPFCDWLALVHPEAGQSLAAGSWQERLRTLPGQLAIVALIGLGPGRAGWQGWVVQRDWVESVRELRVIGPGMLRAVCRGDRLLREYVAHGEEMERILRPPLQESPPERWSRTCGAVGEPVWREVSRSGIALLGASRTGSAMAFQLAGLGVRRLVLVDPDKLEVHNLDAAVGFTEEDVGHPKVHALASRLAAYRSDLALHALDCAATDARVIDAVRGCDLLVTCVDRDAPRLAAALLARRFLKIHLDVGTGVSATDSNERLLAGDVRLLLPGWGCVCCVGGLNSEKEARCELLASPDAPNRRRPVPWTQQRAGSLITINAMAVSTAVQLWLDLLAGRLRTSYWNRLSWQPGVGIESQGTAFMGGEQCSMCGGVRLVQHPA